ncbi:ribonuclease HII [Geofilum rubicundum]|uniref:Ribonuclease HII n=1 Tax=Geofilum rubicundum JCM 15548 TaxID=1236989 RepID=A0A0E9LZC1_9BACT|nr:ribonuclease HII [Geofilum rubicundum]GAO30599.1 ribonuclease HII [Geofilum rubicundum JCM 15548]
MIKTPLQACFKQGETEAGCDEAGRGCLAGPVVAAAVILPDHFSHPLLNDSKQLTHKQRNLLRTIIQDQAISWAVAMVHNQEIDQINILNASIKAMHLAIEQLSTKPTLLLIDGNRFHRYPDTPHQCIIKGDATFLSIAAASVLAKTHRDEYMEAAHARHPHYGWDKNKGYPTKVHRAGIAAHGITPLHRKSFRLTDQQLSLEL